MARIQKLNFFNKSKFKKLKPFLNTNRNNGFMQLLSISPLGHLHRFLPLKYKFLDESYVITENGESLGVVTVSPILGNYSKLNISQLFFSNNSYDVAKQLIDYIVAYYGANGASMLYTQFNENHTELLSLFTNSCGFRQCSAEEIWEITKRTFHKTNRLKYRRLRDADLKDVSNIYNDSLITYFKPTLERSEKEFSESFCYGLTYSTSFRFVVEDNSSGRIIAYFLILTDDNENFIIDFNYSDGYDIDFDDIIHFAIREILKRQKKFKLFIKIKRYLKTTERQKDYFIANNFEWKQTNQLLVKEFYKLIKQELPFKEFIMMGEIVGK